MKCNWRPYLINESDNGNNNKQSKQMTKQTEYLGRSKKREIQKMELKELFLLSLLSGKGKKKKYIYIYIYIYIYMP